MQNFLDSSLRSVEIFLTWVESHREKIEWLSSYRETFGSVADFGCNIGYETIALMWFLGAQEAVGIDKSESGIRQALDTIRHFSEDLRSIWYYVNHISELSQETRSYARSLVSKYSHCSLPSYLVADITERTELPSDHFDLSYCERVLYQIACDDTQKEADGVQRAISELARVTKPGGLVVAIEPTTCSLEDDTVVELNPFFALAGLVRLESPTDLFLAERKATYLYTKPE